MTSSTSKPLRMHCSVSSNRGRAEHPCCTKPETDSVSVSGLILRRMQKTSKLNETHQRKDGRPQINLQHQHWRAMQLREGILARHHTCCVRSDRPHCCVRSDRHLLTSLAFRYTLVGTRGSSCRNPRDPRRDLCRDPRIQMYRVQILKGERLARH